MRSSTFIKGILIMKCLNAACRRRPLAEEDRLQRAGRVAGRAARKLLDELLEGLLGLPEKHQEAAGKTAGSCWGYQKSCWKPIRKAPEKRQEAAGNQSLNKRFEYHGVVPPVGGDLHPDVKLELGSGEYPAYVLCRLDPDAFYV